MSIIDDDGFSVGEDYLKPKKSEDPFKIDFNIGGYGKALTDSLIGSAGGDGGALPASTPDIGKMSFKLDNNTYSNPQLDSAAETKVPAFKPIKPVVVTPPAAVVKPAVKASDTSFIDKATTYLNRAAQPESDASIDRGTLGLRIQTEAKVDPETAMGIINKVNKIADPERVASSDRATLGMRVQKEAQFNLNEAAGTLNRMAEHDNDASAQRGNLGIQFSQEAQSDPEQVEQIAESINQNYYAPNEYAEQVAEPAHMLAQLQSKKRLHSWGDTFSRLFKQSGDAEYAMTSNRAHGMAGWNNVQFDPSVVNGYSDYERRIARDTISTALNKKHEVSYDPEMAKKQILPYLDRFNSPHGYYNNATHSGFSGSSFSIDDLNNQVRDHMLTGSNVTLAQVEQTAQAMASLDNTTYGKTVRNFIASVDMGMLNVGQEAVKTTAMVLSSLPPPEIAMFHYQQMYLAHGNDTAGFAQEVENMAVTGNRMGNWGYGQLHDVKEKFAGIRTDDYNDLRYFTTDPAKMALFRPDKMVGDFFEKFVPSIASLYLPTKGAAVAELRQGAKLITQFAWIAKSAYNTAASEKLMKLQRNPSLVDNDPEFHRYMQNSPIAQSDPQKAREYFMEGASRKSGLQGALVAVVTYGGSRGLRSVTSTGTEGPVLQYLQRFILHEAKNMGDEAIGSVNEAILRDAEMIGGEREED